MRNYILSYDKPTPITGEDYTKFKKEDIPNLSENNIGHTFREDGWEQYSLPIGNGYFGANIFGGTVSERIQITENSLSNPYGDGGYGGLNNFLEMYVNFYHETSCDYCRSLNLNEAIAAVKYKSNGVTYTREFFANYPSRVLVCRFISSQKGALSCDISAQIPFLCDYLYYEGDKKGKTGDISYTDSEIAARGEMEYYGIKYESIIRVMSCGGTQLKKEDSICVTDADSVTLIASFGTNYKFEPRVFTQPEPRKKLEGYPHPHNRLKSIVDTAFDKGYDRLKSEHTKDFKTFFNRVELSVSKESDAFTDALLENYRSGNCNTYLEELYFHYGRYLLLSSSRPGTYPANLQGTWNKYQVPPWSSGYWHNINVQMNYWCSFNTNLSECFAPYLKYFSCYLPLARKMADNYIREAAPEKLSSSGKNGWTISTAAWLYTLLEDPVHGRHSGPGTAGFTVQLLWDYYCFTKDEKALKDVIFDALYEAAVFFLKVLVEKDGALLVKHSASPEQIHKGERYETVGCAFDQQMVYECFKALIEAADILDYTDDVVNQVKASIELLEPVLVGEDGQIKEYREEKHYGDIGEYHHRHISQLVGAYPGTIINSNTPEFLEAAKISLEKRGDLSTGWATAHRLNVWARTKCGNRTHKLLSQLLSKCTYPNLWDAHPPFQIDGNLGGTAGIAEMLIQSHEGYIDVLPALPDAWKDGYFNGLTARGAFIVNAAWKDKKLTHLEIVSQKGGSLKVNGRFERVLCDDSECKMVYENNLSCLETESGKKYCFIGELI